MTRYLHPIVLSKSDIIRFQKLLLRDPVTGCLIWQGHIRTKWGYGGFRIGGEMVLTHRVAWVAAGRVITPERPFILHDCPCGDTPACCEIKHLWDGTMADNAADMAYKMRGCVSEKGLPFGAKIQRSNGRYQSRARIAGSLRCLGTYDTAEEASKVAIAARDKWLNEWRANRRGVVP